MAFDLNSRKTLIVGIILRVITGLFFIFSAFSKLYPVEFFEYSLVGDHLASWSTAGIFARLIIGFELFLGISFLANFEYRKLIVWAGIVLTSIFTIYLFLVLLLKGNEPNCNCFGQAIRISVSASLLKNCFLLIVLWSINKISAGLSYRFPRIILTSALIISIASIFMLNPINKDFANAADESDKGFKLDLDFLYHNKSYKRPEVALNKGKHIVALFSLSCPHCRVAALKFSILKKNNPQLPIYFLLNGDSTELHDFYEDTNTEAIPSNIIPDNRFITLSGLSVPAIFFEKDGIVEQRVDYITLSEKMITDWMMSKH